MDAVFSVAAIRGGGGGGCVDRVPVLAVLTTSTCMLPVLSRLSRSARGFIRCLESEGGGSLLNSSWCKMVGVAGGAGGELGDVNATGALTAESSASNECLTHTHTHTHTHTWTESSLSTNLTDDTLADEQTFQYGMYMYVHRYCR